MANRVLPTPTTDQGIAVHLERTHDRGKPLHPYRRWRLRPLQSEHERQHLMGTDHEHEEIPDTERTSDG